MKLFAGSSNPLLAEKIAANLGVPLALCQLLKFDDGELKPVIQEDVRDETCVILQSTTKDPNNFWMELLLMVDALKREAAKKVVAVIPSFGYARQNQQHKKGEPVSAHVVVHFLENVGISEVITVDLHDETMTGMFDIPITNISALPLLAQNLKPELPGKVVVAAPDQGGIERARLFASALGADISVVTVEKKRELDKVHQSHAVQVMGEVANLPVVIEDDIITSGGTILNAMTALKEKGAGEIYVCVTHEDFAKDTAQKLQGSSLKKMLVTNSVAIDPSHIFPKLQVVDISGLLSEEIKKIV